MATTTTYIPDREVDAEACRSCGTSWKKCLTNKGKGPEGVCCADCHLHVAHNQDAARQREAQHRRETNFDLWRPAAPAR